MPFECEWEAGATIVSRQVRLVVNLKAGGRVVRTVAHRQRQSFAETVDVDVVQVTATVTDERGRYVDGLPRSAFHVLEDGKPQTISHFYADDAPLELVVALDLSTSMQPALAEMKRAVSAFLRALPARHRLTLLGFNDDVFTLAPRTADAVDREKVVAALSAWGMTALYEAVHPERRDCWRHVPAVKPPSCSPTGRIRAATSRSTMSSARCRRATRSST